MITHLNEKLIAVEVPSDAIKYKISGLNYFCIYISRADKKDGATYCQPFEKLDSNYKILGEVDADNISFDVEQYVESYYTQFTIKNKLLFKNYLEEKINSYLESKNESFRSLLKSKGIDTNKQNVKHVILYKL